MDRLVFGFVIVVPVWSECAGAFLSAPYVSFVPGVPSAEVDPVFESAGFLTAFGGAVSLVSVLFLVWFSA